MEKRDNKSLIKDEFKGIDSVSDDELEYFGSDPMKKAAVEEIIEKSKISHKSRGIRIPVWYEYAGPAKKFCFFSTLLLILHFPLSVVGMILLFFIGALVDRLMFKPTLYTLGHAVPVFVVMLPFFGIYIFIIFGIVLLLAVIVSLIIYKVKKE
ncbi:MAG: hypothetical protein J6P37_04010 [Lachnospiraceae bacterium]|nr:hypothetical protein [Lachnospiraceae bacterium]